MQAGQVHDIFKIVTPSSLDDLRRVPRAFRVVQHEPRTPRYDKAFQKMDYVVREARFLGARAAEVADPTRVELATWARHPAGHGCGYYACFRLFYGDDGQPTFAAMFCFYDGTDSSPCIRSYDAAAVLALSHGFRLDHDS